jgi:CheY-like chemotaxis protein
MENTKKILLVEDDEYDIELTLDALEKINIHSIDIARNGKEALDYLMSRDKFSERTGGNPELVLLDNKMPKMTGIELLGKMKSDENLKTIPVVMLTSSKEESDIVKSYALGVNAYVVKPVIPEQFLEAVRHLGSFWTEFNVPPPATGGIRKNE